ncbi:hypothetical protein Bcep1808_5123 [Burkholderia vietnamiensis G4]|uniref:Uncharacterized protein n=1 Tax=Burkholderia vietnamiensis (strain G4 / LMG 22486) TaxID=269482 RepID=A4JP71_BURVG|nr:hypothetical protein Bcep1808_5123 [Burkholderia vietnamiensis G4]
MTTAISGAWAVPARSGTTIVREPWENDVVATVRSVAASTNATWPVAGRGQSGRMRACCASALSTVNEQGGSTIMPVKRTMPDAPAAKEDDETRSAAARANEAVARRCFMTGSRVEARRSEAARMAGRQRCGAVCVNGKFIEPLE